MESLSSTLSPPPPTVVEAITRRRPITSISRTPTPIPPSSSSSQSPPPPSSSIANTGRRERGGVGDCCEDHGESPGSEAVLEETTNKLKRKLHLIDVIFYGIGCSVGAGIYSLIGIGADLAGPSLAISFLLCGIACIFTSFSYAEFASLIPLSGSAYTFVYVSFGELAGWLVGWNLTLGYAISAAVVARSWSEYFVGFLQGLAVGGGGTGVKGGDRDTTTLLSSWDLSFLTKLPIPFFSDEEQEQYYTCCPLSMIIIGICTLILVTGVKESSKFNTFMTLLNLAILLFVILWGTPYVSLDNLLPIFPHGLKGVAKGSGLVFFSYLGFDMVACLSEEVVEPQRNMPIGIIGSLCASMTIYVITSIVVIGMVPLQLLGDDTPILNALLANACCTHLEQVEGQECLSYTTCPVIHSVLYHGSRIVSFGAIFGLTTATFACLMGQPRINYAAANDGLLFPIFKQINPSTGIPTAGTIITGILTALIACFVELETLANAISLGTLMVFTFVNAGIILLRMRPSIVTTENEEKEEQRLDIRQQRNSKSQDEDETSPLLVFRTSGSSDENTSNNTMINHAVVHPPPPSSPFVPNHPELESYIRALGLIKESSRDVRELLRQRSLASEAAPPLTVHDNGSKPIWCVTLFTLSSVVGSMALSNEWSQWISLVCGCFMMVTAFLLFRFPQSLPQVPGELGQATSLSTSLEEKEKVLHDHENGHSTIVTPTIFRCPFVPGIPLLGIVCNCYMMGSMSLETTWLIIGIWLLMGMLFYFSYGIHHSELNLHKQHEQRHY